ncbi:MAG TPA: ArsA family ATPase [Actinomyces sp.]|nr:ArsA family ATPase [Actinomyces sp.]
MLSDTVDSRVVFVGGKGGVGKTSVSSALAYGRMLEGKRVLLVSTDPAHNLGHLWDAKLGDGVTRLAQADGDTTNRRQANADRGDGGLIDGVEIDPHDVVDQHFNAVYKQMLRMLPERLHGPAKKHLDSARKAPGSYEAAILERIAENVQLGLAEYDVVIFDTAPTGHTLHLLTLPDQLFTWTEQLLKSRQRSTQYTGVLGSIVTGKNVEDTSDHDAQLRRTLIRRQEKLGALRDAMESDAGFIVVTLAEPMPVAESLDLLDQLADLKMRVASVVVNRRSPVDAGPFLAHKHDLEEVQIKRLEGEVGRIPVHQLPLLQEPPQGVDGIAAIVDSMTEA